MTHYPTLTSASKALRGLTSCDVHRELLSSRDCNLDAKLSQFLPSQGFTDVHTVYAGILSLNLTAWLNACNVYMELQTQKFCSSCQASADVVGLGCCWPSWGPVVLPRHCYCPPLEAGQQGDPLLTRSTGAQAARVLHVESLLPRFEKLKLSFAIKGSELQSCSEVESDKCPSMDCANFVPNHCSWLTSGGLIPETFLFSIISCRTIQTEGNVTYNSEKMTPAVRKRIGYVTQMSF